jgi:hypothetical protein
VAAQPVTLTALRLDVAGQLVPRFFLVADLLPLSQPALFLKWEQEGAVAGNVVGPAATLSGRSLR